MRQHTTQSAKVERKFFFNLWEPPTGEIYLCCILLKKPPFKPQPTVSDWNVVLPKNSCRHTFRPTVTIPDQSKRRAETKTEIIKRDDSTIAASSFIFVTCTSGLSWKRRLFLNFAHLRESRKNYLHENRRPFSLNATLRKIKTFDKYGRRFITCWSGFKEFSRKPAEKTAKTTASLLGKRFTLTHVIWDIVLRLINVVVLPKKKKKFFGLTLGDPNNWCCHQRRHDWVHKHLTMKRKK